MHTTVETIAGTGVAGFERDEGPATAGRIAEPFGVVEGPDDAIYLCDLGNHRIRRVDPATDALSTVAGNGRQGYAGDGGRLPAVRGDFRA